MKWMPAAQHLPPNRTSVVVETWFGHFLAAYVAPESVTFEDFYNRDLCCYDEEYARDFVHTGWYARCQNGYFPYWPLSCEVLRWSSVRDDDPALRWIDCTVRKPAALETVLIKTVSGNYCAFYVPPQTVTLSDFIRFDTNIAYHRNAWEYIGDGHPPCIRAGWHIPVCCDGGKKMSMALPRNASHWAYIPKISGKNENGIHGGTR